MGSLAFLNPASSSCRAQAMTGLTCSKAPYHIITDATLEPCQRLGVGTHQDGHSRPELSGSRATVTGEGMAVTSRSYLVSTTLSFRGNDCRNKNKQTQLGHTNHCCNRGSFNPKKCPPGFHTNGPNWLRTTRRICTSCHSLKNKLVWVYCGAGAWQGGGGPHLSHVIPRQKAPGAGGGNRR